MRLSADKNSIDGNRVDGDGRTGNINENNLVNRSLDLRIHVTYLTILVTTFN